MTAIRSGVSLYALRRNGAQCLSKAAADMCLRLPLNKISALPRRAASSAVVPVLGTASIARFCLKKICTFYPPFHSTLASLGLDQGCENTLSFWPSLAFVWGQSPRLVVCKARDSQPLCLPVAFKTFGNHEDVAVDVFDVCLAAQRHGYI